jgi:hypothetical protein
MNDKINPISFELGASFKAELKAEVPKESTGRLIDALTDLIRPFSENRGLRADQIRLQREDVLIEIAKKTHQRLHLLGTKPEPIPNKILLPLLENASLEDISDEAMIERWSNLLAEAATGQAGNRLSQIKALSSINSHQANLLEHLFLNSDNTDVHLIENLSKPYSTQEFFSLISTLESCPREKLAELAAEAEGANYLFVGEDIPLTSHFPIAQHDFIRDLSHLEFLDLIWLNACSFHNGKETHFLVSGKLTAFGYDLVDAIKAIQKNHN